MIFELAFLFLSFSYLYMLSLRTGEVRTYSFCLRFLNFGSYRVTVVLSSRRVGTFTVTCQFSYVDERLYRRATRDFDDPESSSSG